MLAEATTGSTVHIESGSLFGFGTTPGWASMSMMEPMFRQQGSLSDSATVGLTGLQHQACGNGTAKAAGFSSVLYCHLCAGSGQHTVQERTASSSLPGCKSRTALEE